MFAGSDSFIKIFVTLQQVAEDGAVYTFIYWLSEQLTVLIL